ncbi:MAG TPA: HupE/UreJ family protein, partial [Gemmatimonadota bacterium]|nr:HupE/UreJ family protein [Gemmatimonadota bacterium]
MLSEFLVYLQLGFEHITDPGGLDHVLFVAVLTATDIDRPKHLFWLVTAFTLGHSLTLALATLRVVSVGSTLVEVLIPLTIIATCVLNAATWKPSGAPSARGGRGDRLRYGLAAGFGLVHGLGFSSFLRAALGGEESILLPLFAFNTGLEVGQL